MSMLSLMIESVVLCSYRKWTPQASPPALRILHASLLTTSSQGTEWPSKSVSDCCSPNNQGLFCSYDDGRDRDWIFFLKATFWFGGPDDIFNFQSWMEWHTFADDVFSRDRYGVTVRNAPGWLPTLSFWTTTVVNDWWVCDPLFSCIKFLLY